MKKKAARTPAALALALKAVEMRRHFAEVGEDRRQRILREQRGNTVAEIQRIRGHGVMTPGLQDYMLHRRTQAAVLGLKIKK